MYLLDRTFIITRPTDAQRPGCGAHLPLPRIPTTDAIELNTKPTTPGGNGAPYKYSVDLYGQLATIGAKKVECVNEARAVDTSVARGIAHIRCLELAKEAGDPCVFICDEEFICTNTARLRNNLVAFEKANPIASDIGAPAIRPTVAGAGVGEWSVILLGGNVEPPYSIPKDVAYCVRLSQCHTPTGFVVHAAAYDSVIASFRAGIKRIVQCSDGGVNATSALWTDVLSTGKCFMLVPLSVTRRTALGDDALAVSKNDAAMLVLDKQWTMTPLFAARYES